MLKECGMKLQWSMSLWLSMSMSWAAVRANRTLDRYVSRTDRPAPSRQYLFFHMIKSNAKISGLPLLMSDEARETKPTMDLVSCEILENVFLFKKNIVWEFRSYFRCRTSHVYSVLASAVSHHRWDTNTQSASHSNISCWSDWPSWVWRLTKIRVV